jgi:hypothetical protein
VIVKSIDPIQDFKRKSVRKRQIPMPIKIGIYDKKDLGKRLKTEGTNVIR